MFTFIKKVIKTGTETHAYPLEPMPVDKNFRGKPEHTPQQCIGCAACVNACPSNALTVEIDLATNQLAWQFNLGRCIFCGRCEEVCPTAAIKLSPEYELAVWKKEDFLQQSRFAICHCRECQRPFAVQKEIDYAIGCSSITAIPAPSCTAKASKPARNASARNAWCRPIVLN